MKKRKLFLAITSIVVLCVLLTSMTACLKIGMRQGNIENKLKDAGASIRYERNTPMTKDGQGDHKLEDLVYATMTYVETVDGVETDVTRSCTSSLRGRFVCKLGGGALRATFLKTLNCATVGKLIARTEW